MAIQVKLPELGDGIESGDVLQVLVQVGDEIRKDQGVVELETDKATVEVPSSHAGRVTQIHVQEGQTVPIGGLLVTIEAVAAEAAQRQPPAESQPQPVREKPAAAQPAPDKPAAAAKSGEPAAPGKSAKPAAPGKSAKPAAPAKTAKPAARRSAPTVPAEPQEPEEAARDEDAAQSAVEAEAVDGSGTIPAGPAVRRFAREVGVDLQRVTGTGPGGRIQREDVLAVVRQAAEAVRTGRAPGKGASADQQYDDWGPVRIERMNKIRRTIAERMHASWTAIPRVTNFDDADVTDLEGIRQASKADYAAEGIKLTSMPFVIKAVAMSLKAHPTMNAAVDLEQGQIIYKEYVHIGIAVDTPRGLVVPVLRDADRLSIPDIARGLASIAEAARENTFSLEDLRGGTFTISNLGAIGGTYSTPIINLPEVAILLVGRTRPMAVVLKDQITSRLMMPLSLSYDHRLVDGATAARFLNDVIGYLRAPSRLLLAP